MTGAARASRLLVRDLTQVVSPEAPGVGDATGPARGADLGRLDVVEDAYLLIAGDRIEATGRMRDLGPVAGEVHELDGRGLVAIPGLVDCHTHPAFAGDRAAEFELRARGASYEELHAAGGGILSTVRATREAGPETLRAAVERHRGWMRAHGTTTFEGKSGYGLDRDTELAQLDAVAAAGGIPTWLGAHAVPPEFESAEAYVGYMVAEVIPHVRGRAAAADVFLERGAFDRVQAERVLRASRAAGLALRLHGDQFTESGAIELAIELGAVSVDHLEATGPDGVRGLAQSDVAAVCLPIAALVLGRPMPPARALADEGAIVVLATDFNPGSAFCESLPLVCSLACTQMRLTPAEALTACTVNAAHVLGLGAEVGRIAPGYRADVVLLGVPDWRHLAYHLGADIVHTVIEEGTVSLVRTA